MISSTSLEVAPASDAHPFSLAHKTLLCYILVCSASSSVVRVYSDYRTHTSCQQIESCKCGSRSF